MVLPVDDLAAWVRMTGLLVQSRSSAGAPDHVARAWASQYSWDAYASRMLDVYSSVAAAAHPAIDVNSPTPFTDRTSP